jgi:hypothetical protein
MATPVSLQKANKKLFSVKYPPRIYHFPSQVVFFLSASSACCWYFSDELRIG